MICGLLGDFSQIGDVLYWERDMYDDIYEYMNENLRKCDILILFCSENADESRPVRMEWMAALKLQKKIIPVFINENSIPTLLTTKLGIKFKENDIKQFSYDLFQLIMRKYKSVDTELDNVQKIGDLRSLKPNIKQEYDYYIKEIIFSGFASFGPNKINLNLSPNLNLIIGPLGSGKSNIIKAVLMVLDYRNEKYFTNYKNLLYISTDSNVVPQAEVIVKFDNNKEKFPYYPFFYLHRIIKNNQENMELVNGIPTSLVDYKKVIELTTINKDTSKRFILVDNDENEFISRSPQERLKIIGQLLKSWNKIENTWNPNFLKIVLPKFIGELQRLCDEDETINSIDISVENPENLSIANLLIKVKMSEGEFIEFDYLSGSEKSYVFLLLYFASILCFPLSFYLFDNIDENLDSLHVAIVSKLLKKISRTSQVIIVGHREEMILSSNMVFRTRKGNNGITNIYPIDILTEPTCPECGGFILTINTGGYESVCSQCGLVLRGPRRI